MRHPPKDSKSVNAEHGLNCEAPTESVSDLAEVDRIVRILAEDQQFIASARQLPEPQQGSILLPPAEPLFGRWAPELYRAGWAVIPLRPREKMPVIPFRNARGMPNPEMSRMARFHDHNVGAVCGLSRGGGYTPHGIVVVDVDDQNDIGKVEELFGATPGKVITRRGAHRYYRMPASGLPMVPGRKALKEISDLRPYGLKADLKHGQRGTAIVVLPPSIHPETGVQSHRWDGCGPEVIHELPLFPVAKLMDMVDRVKKLVIPGFKLPTALDITTVSISLAQPIDANAQRETETPEVTYNETILHPCRSSGRRDLEGGSFF